MTWKILHWASRIFIGVIFIYAGYTKINWTDITLPQLQFAAAIEAYQLLPEWSVWTVTRYLPWVEILLGVMILVGWKLRYFASAGAALLGLFIVAMAVTYARGIDADCGCFGVGEKISPFTLLRDTVMLLPAIYLSVREWRKGEARSATPPPPAAAQAA